jgi:hypothetical protein
MISSYHCLQVSTIVDCITHVEILTPYDILDTLKGSNEGGSLEQSVSSLNVALDELTKVKKGIFQLNKIPYFYC